MRTLARRTRISLLLIVVFVVPSIPTLLRVFAGQEFVLEHRAAFLTLIGVCTVICIGLLTLLLVDENKRRRIE